MEDPKIWEESTGGHTGHGNRWTSTQARIPSTTQSGRVQCSVTRLARYPPLQYPLIPSTLRWDVSGWLRVWSRWSLKRVASDIPGGTWSSSSYPSSGYRRPLHHPGIRVHWTACYVDALLHKTKAYGVYKHQWMGRPDLKSLQWNRFGFALHYIFSTDELCSRIQ
jgi:hypothetical protein